MKKHINIVFILIFILFGNFSAHAAPSVYHKDGPTLVFTMWDVATDKTYIIDLDIKAIDFYNKPMPFEFNIINIVNSKIADSAGISTLNNFRWSVVGGVWVRQNLGYVASYNKTKPFASETYWIKQRIQRWHVYINRDNYTKGPNAVLVKESGDPGHYIELWQGNFNGLSDGNLHARVGADEGMEIWSIFAEDRVKNKTKKLGNITLTPNGVLKFTPS